VVTPNILDIEAICKAFISTVYTVRDVAWIIGAGGGLQFCRPQKS